MTADRAALVEKVAAEIRKYDLTSDEIAAFALDLIRAETLEEAALVKVPPPTFTGTMEEQAFFLKGWMEAMSAKRFAIRALKG